MNHPQKYNHTVASNMTCVDLVPITRNLADPDPVPMPAQKLFCRTKYRVQAPHFAVDLLS